MAHQQPKVCSQFLFCWGKKFHSTSYSQSYITTQVRTENICIIFLRRLVVVTINEVGIASIECSLATDVK